MAIKTILILNVLIVSVFSWDYSSRVLEKYAEDHQFPHHVLLEISLLPGKDKLYCGGTLISPEHVLTAAHCLQTRYGNKYDKATVYLGVHKLQLNSDPRVDSDQTIIAYEENFKVNGDFDSSTGIHNIGVINLPKRAIINEFVKSANLPSKSIGNLVGKKFYGAGWGRTAGEFFQSLENHNLLRYIELNVSEGSLCEKIYTKNSTSDKYQICADRYKQRTPCVQDSGAPIVIQEADSSYTMIGVVSYYPVTACSNGEPLIAARVSAYLDWISSNTGIAVQN